MVLPCQLFEILAHDHAQVHAVLEFPRDALEPRASGRRRSTAPRFHRPFPAASDCSASPIHSSPRYDGMITVSHGRETFVLVVMQATVLRVVVSGSLCYRLWVPTTLLIIAVTLNAVLGQLMLKYAVIGLGGSPALSNLPAFILTAAKSPLVYVSIAIQGFGYLLWMMLIARMKLGLASASVGAGFYVCMALAAWGVYGESLSRLQWLGLGLITLGVSCIGLASAS